MSARSKRAAGDQVGPWLLEGRLGQGGFSEVWRARWSPPPQAEASGPVVTLEPGLDLRPGVGATPGAIPAGATPGSTPTPTLPAATTSGSSSARATPAAMTTCGPPAGAAPAAMTTCGPPAGALQPASTVTADGPPDPATGAPRGSPRAVALTSPFATSPRPALTGGGARSRATTRRFHPPAPGEVVALKLHVHPEHAAQLRQEAESLAHVIGPGVVRVLDMDLAEDPPWLALELLDHSLREREARLRAERAVPGAPDTTTLDVVRALDTFEALLGVMARVHAEGVVHGDLKPENVLFTRGGELRVADFGLSRRISQRTATLSVSLSQEDVRLAGTLDYMAPEQRRGERPTTRSDVFALGVILYELLTGRRPQGSFELPSALVPAVPPAIDRVVECCLAAEPQRRFAAAGAVLAFLRSLARDDWRRLDAARGRARALLLHGALQELVRPGMFSTAQLFVAGVTAFAVARIAWDGFLLPRAALPGALLAIALSTAAILGAWRVIGPWLEVRRARLVTLSHRLEAQVRTGRAWARAAAPARPWSRR